MATRELTCGHPDRKHNARGMCKPCYVQHWQRLHPEKSAKEWVRKNPERARELWRRGQLKRRGITAEDYDALWIKQGGKCANPGCSNTAPMKMDDYNSGLQVDHCHATGAVRALLCGGCNRALGHIGDDAGRLAGLITYLGSVNSGVLVVPVEVANP